MSDSRSVSVCGRRFTPEDLAWIDAVQVSEPGICRAEIARRLCARLEWRSPGGQLQAMSARVALLRLAARGLVRLPPPRGRNGNGRAQRLAALAAEEPACPVGGTVGELRGLRLAPVQSPAESARWNAAVSRYHYLGYKPLAGAQLRYLVQSDAGLLGVLGFGAAAWKVAVRDRWIGWDARARAAHLGRVLNNARFLLLPWVQVKNLASKVLALAAARVAEDFPARYGEPVVLLETFVERPRFAGTCYRAANWQYLGETAGRGKCDRTRQAALPRKAVYVYPLAADFRAALGVA
jgi:hypothetical protein